MQVYKHVLYRLMGGKSVHIFDKDKYAFFRLGIRLGLAVVTFRS